MKMVVDEILNILVAGRDTVFIYVCMGTTQSGLDPFLDCIIHYLCRVLLDSASRDFSSS